MPLLIPKPEEQVEIVEYIEKSINNIDEVIKKTEESVFKMREYVTALTSAAVTGKIDVRGE